MPSISSTPANHSAFCGAKLLCFVGGRLVVLLRDDVSTIPFPGHWDLPGGGREGGESPAACVLRETRAEVGLALDPADLIWGRAYTVAGQTNWMFAAELPGRFERDLVLGDEGQRLDLMTPQDYGAHPLAIPQFVGRLADYLREKPSDQKTPRC